MFVIFFQIMKIDRKTDPKVIEQAKKHYCKYLNLYMVAVDYE
jgi:hypothetical protein